MDLIPIGQASGRLGMGASALRYYDERKLVCPSTRHAGKRVYSAEQLRRLAFIKIANRLGVPLQTAAAVLVAPGPQWRQTGEYLPRPPSPADGQKAAGRSI